VPAAAAAAKSANTRTISIGTSCAEGPLVRSFHIIFALVVRAAAAGRLGEAPPDPPASREVPPEQVSGVIVDDDNSSSLRDVGRVILYPVRLGPRRPVRSRW
jgi:hypothetical protein